MKLYIVTDLEGCSGVVRESQLHGGAPAVVRANRILAAETNAAVGAACSAGADEILVAHGHTSPDELELDLYDERPKYVLGVDVAGTLDGSFAALGFVGQHALSSSGGVLEHTYDMRNYHRITLNGRMVGEIGFIAAVAGDCGVPVAFLSGDEAACREVEELCPGVATAAVKRGLSRNAAVTLHPKAAAELIASAVADGLARAGDITPFSVAGPVEMVVEYNSCAPVERNTLIPGVEAAGPRAVKFTGPTATDCYRMFALMGRIV